MDNHHPLLYIDICVLSSEWKELSVCPVGYNRDACSCKTIFFFRESFVWNLIKIFFFVSGKFANGGASSSQIFSKLKDLMIDFRVRAGHLTQ